MSDVILVAMSDTPVALRAAAVAIRQAKEVGANVRVVTVIPEDDRDVLRSTAHGTGAERELAAADGLLKHVVMLGETAGVVVTGVRRTGRVATEILAEAREADARMIVMARVDRPGHAIPTIGSHTLRVLEFSTVPVLVVPDGLPHKRGRTP